jgi:polyisoprenoid-binding protein YceI
MASKLRTIDTSNSAVSFKVKKLGVLTINGTISDFTGDVAFSKETLEDASFHVCVSPSTIDTGNVKRDEHLRSKDFFFVNEYPKICFQTTSVQAVNNGYVANGKRTIAEASREVSIPFSFSDGVFAGQFAINRVDFSLGKKFPAFIVGKTIQISIRCKISQS